MMATEASDKLNVSDDFDDEDGPVVFKRTNTTSKKNQLISEVEKSTSSLDGQTHRKTPDMSTSKSGSALFKKQVKKMKKSGSKSEYSKSTKLLPSAGDGQKKWTTLVHNGVIFPPPYKPHGIKMLYKGKPVDLTPEQEEECL
ncbi:hypothetical protein K1719_030525 [Acacia pycnantha]|nr:hypothetical protein K1719_030525 [Acacia pycnantha]